ncbi:hypothetical protein [Kitasatospora sp. KL5]|uniref:hypothetical protein n=1 Tax=Kitasatospora sp. KL5 TaxID=3425125 RepID=UPI003D6E6599
MTWLKASSAALPPADRFEWFLETLARELMPTAVSTTDRAAFRAEAAVPDLGAVQLSRYSHSPLLSRRTRPSSGAPARRPAAVG